MEGPPPQGPQAPPRPPGWQPQPAAYAGLQLASWGSRAGAWAVDFLVILALWIGVFIPGGVVAGLGADALGVVLLILGGMAAIAAAILYAPWLMQRPGPHNGQTLGKQLLRVRVVRVTGQPADWGLGLMREIVLKGIALWLASLVAGGLTFFLLGIGGLAPYFANYLWPLWDDQNRAVHDMIAETRVVTA